MTYSPFWLSLLIAAPAFGQSMYKCPSSTPGAPAIYQQMPCTPTGGGETVTVKPIPAGTGSGLSDSAKAYLEERDKARQQPNSASTPQRSGEVEKECMAMRKRIMRMEDREASGMHTWSKGTGVEQSQYLKQEYEKLCGPW